jgi:hypothetical protein
MGYGARLGQALLYVMVLHLRSVVRPGVHAIRTASCGLLGV